MNKKVLSAILFSALFAGTGTFTSCIDTDEPAGIEELRGAKAELIRAKVAVEQAEAAFKLAQAEVQKAEAARLQSLAKINEASARLEEARAEAAEIQNEEDRILLEQKIDEITKEMELAALEHEAALLGAQEELAVAKRSYEIALKQIAIAEALMSESDKVALSELVGIVDDLMAKVDAKEAEIAAKQEDLYHDALYLDADTEYQTALFEKRVTKAKNALTHNANTIAKYKKYLADGPAETDWRSEVAQLEDSIAGLQKEQDLIDLQIVKVQNSQEYKDLNDAVTKASNAYSTLKVGSVYSYEYMEYEGNVTKNLHIADADGNVEVSYNTNADNAKKALVTKSLDALAGTNWNSKTDGLIYKHNYQIGWYTTERKALLDSIAKHATADAAKTKENAEKAVTAWENALAAFKGAKDINTEAMYKAGTGSAEATGALPTYEKAINKSGATDEDKLLAKQAFADAIVAYYNTLPSTQVAFTTITLATEVDGDMIYTAKTAKEWLSDTSLKHKNLIKLYEYFGNDFTPLWEVNDLDFNADGTVDGEQKNANGSLKTGGAVTGAFSAFKKKDKLQEELTAKSTTAFGNAQIYANGTALGNEQGDSYMHTKPTLEDVKRLVFVEGKAQDEKTIGKWGMYLLSVDSETVWHAKNYAAIIENLEGAVEYWTETVAALKAARSASYAELAAADNAFKAYKKANITDLQNTSAAYAERIGRLENVKDALIGAVDKYLQPNYEDLGGEMKFVEWLKKQVASLEDNVSKLEYDLACAEADLKAVKEGHFKVAEHVKELQEQLADLEAELADLVKELEEAIADVKAAESIWAGTAE